MPFLTLTQQRLLIVLVSFVLLLSSPPIPSIAQDTPVGLTVYVVNYPLQYFAERIAGQHASVVLPVPEDEDPTFWIPDPATITAYQRADPLALMPVCPR